MEAPAEEKLSEHYRDGFDHLSDELKRIDLLILRSVMELRRSRGEGADEKYRGLFISDEEIDHILGKSPGEDGSAIPPSSDEGEWEKIDKKIGEVGERIDRRLAATLKKGGFLPLNYLASVLGLGRIETDFILICLAPELDLKYERIYSYLNDDVTRKRATVDLMLNLLGFSVVDKVKMRPAFSADAPLFRYGILRYTPEPQGGEGAWLSRPLRLEDRITDFLAGFQHPDPRISPFADPVTPRGGLERLIAGDITKERLKSLLPLLDADGGRTVLAHFRGPCGNGQQSAAEALCHELGRGLLAVDVRHMIESGGRPDASLMLVLREALLTFSAVFISNFDILIERWESEKAGEAAFTGVLKHFPVTLFLEGEREWTPDDGQGPFQSLIVHFPYPDYPLRRTLWKNFLNGHAAAGDIDIDVLAGSFQLTRDQVISAIGRASDSARMRGDDTVPLTMEDMYSGCRAVSSSSLGRLARKIEPRYGWDNIVLLPDASRQLNDICSQVRHRQVVYGDWGFGRKLSLGKGLNAIFYGPSGTGKTMAAEVIARDIGLDIYKVDLSTVVSKYIGETEKNLGKIFGEAQRSNSIIFFDEADALFGKRSEVKDAHDRYANIEVAYLLQKMEEYEGLVILATNLKDNMDDAFVRRMHFIVEFPFPEAKQRLGIWKAVIPEEAPLAEEEIDFDFLSRKFSLSGGNIKNIVLSAAFLAAEDSGQIGMGHIMRASRREFQKMGKLCVQSDFGKYSQLLA